MRYSHKLNKMGYGVAEGKFGRQSVFIFLSLRVSSQELLIGCHDKWHWESAVKFT